MLKRVFLALCIAVAVGAASFSTGVTRKDVSARNVKIPVIDNAGVAKTNGQVPGEVDGSVNPGPVPDHVAYSLLFRLLADRNTVEEKKRAKSYLRMAFGCNDCEAAGGDNSRGLQAAGEAHVGAFLAVLNEYQKRVGALDRKARKIWAGGAANLGPQDLADLNELQTQKEAIIAEIVASLPERLGRDGEQRLRRHVDGRVKPKVRMSPDHVHR